MAPDRQQRQKQLLAGLFVVLVLVLLWQWWNWDSVDDANVAASPTQPRTASRETGQAPSEPFEGDVNLDALEQERPAPTGGGRNPFQFEADAPPPTTKPQVVKKPTGPPQPKGPPPIPLKFIGTLFKQGWKGKVAVLSDGKSVFHGKQGEVIDGRFRIVQIGEESVQLEYVGGQGRQVIRLSGQ
ncbi:MAG: hypothetical protein GEU99_09555 [Luteitalea sp.]|nr:hypothetical protein [Luteitalea sp.]